MFVLKTKILQDFDRRCLNLDDDKTLKTHTLEQLLEHCCDLIRPHWNPVL
jgi:hypothetical protein